MLRFNQSMSILPLMYQNLLERTFMPSFNTLHTKSPFFIQLKHSEQVWIQIKYFYPPLLEKPSKIPPGKIAWLQSFYEEAKELPGGTTGLGCDWGTSWDPVGERSNGEDKKLNESGGDPAPWNPKLEYDPTKYCKAKSYFMSTNYFSLQVFHCGNQKHQVLFLPVLQIWVQLFKYRSYYDNSR